MKDLSFSALRLDYLTLGITILTYATTAERGVKLRYLLATPDPPAPATLTETSTKTLSATLTETLSATSAATRQCQLQHGNAYRLAEVRRANCTPTS